MEVHGDERVAQLVSRELPGRRPGRLPLRVEQYRPVRHLEWEVERPEPTVEEGPSVARRGSTVGTGRRPSTVVAEVGSRAEGLPG